MNLITKKSFKDAALILVTLFLMVGGYKLLKKPAKNQEELVAGMFVWTPFMSVKPDGNYEGFDVDVAQELAKRMGKKLVIKDLGSLAPLFIALEQGKIDMLFSGLDITQQRMSKMNMISYTGQAADYCLMFWDKIPESIKTIQDLRTYPNPVVCVEPGVSTEKFIDQLPYISKKSLSSKTDMLLDLRYGKSLAAFIEINMAKRLQQKNPQLQILQVPLPPEFQIYGMGIAVQKNNQTLTGQATRIIEEMKQDGTIKRFETKWQLEG